MIRQTFLLLLLSAAIAGAQTVVRPGPPNGPAAVEISGPSLVVHYNGKVILSATMSPGADSLRHRVNISREGDRVEQTILLWAGDGNRKLVLTGSVVGSEEAFACESDRPSRGPLIVRHASGQSRNLRNRGVYDRQGDWVLSVDANPKVTLRPDPSGGRSRRSFSISVEGREIVLRFRPRFYQKHRGLSHFEPWAYSVWPKSVAGWISWFAFYDSVSERTMVETAEVFSETLAPYGFEYFQLDDGYQQGKGEPRLWLTPNEKFPHGLPFLTRDLKSRGLKPGIWTAVSITQEDLVRKHPAWFVRDSAGNPVMGNWIEYVLDASNPEAMETVVRPLYRGLREQGWEYFKVDALRHLRYEGYNAHRDYFERTQQSLEDVYRGYMKTVREETGRDRFVLGCWGIRPELVGLIDGCRIGDDGFSYAGLAQYNSFNNVVWRNDPDHIELNEDAYRSTMVTSLTGSLLMLTDKPAVYKTPIIECAKRAVPVLFTVPGQIYDVDPSRSDQLSRVGAEVTGSGPRPFDAGYTTDCHLYLLEITRDWDSWCILGRSGGEFAEIRFADLGLETGRDYIVFEFWSRRLVGTVRGSFHPGALNGKYRSQVFCIREREQRPQFVASSRHITCGGVEIETLRWRGNALAGRCSPLPREPYVLYLTEPSGYTFREFQYPQGPPAKVERAGELLCITVEPAATGSWEWRAVYD